MNKFEDIRGVAFDLDGTLVDSRVLRSRTSHIFPGSCK